MSSLLLLKRRKLLNSCKRKLKLNKLLIKKLKNWLLPRRQRFIRSLNKRKPPSWLSLLPTKRQLRRLLNRIRPRLLNRLLNRPKPRLPQTKLLPKKPLLLNKLKHNNKLKLRQKLRKLKLKPKKPKLNPKRNILLLNYLPPPKKKNLPNSLRPRLAKKLDSPKSLSPSKSTSNKPKPLLTRPMPLALPLKS
jgi:hypothetical protein